jgi:uncharacterized protein
MADIRGFPQSTTQSGVAIDQGLRAYMLKVYNYMAGGLLITALGAYLTFHAAVGADGGLTQFGDVVFHSPVRWLLVFAPLGLVMFLSWRINSMSVAAAQTTFWIYAALVGMSLSTLGLVYTGASIARVFLITAAAFGSLSLYGYTTKRDLTGMGSFLFMGLMGIIIASIVNLFFHSPAMTFALSVISVLIFTGLTAYDSQQIKNMYYEGDDSLAIGRKAISGALHLYLDFINLFMSLLRLFGDRR